MSTISPTAAKAAGLTTLNQVEALRLLAEDSETMSILAGGLGVSTAAMTVIADKLQSLGIAERYCGQKDRRLIWLRLTPQGRKVAALILSPAAA